MDLITYALLNKKITSGEGMSRDAVGTLPIGKATPLPLTATESNDILGGITKIYEISLIKTLSEDQMKDIHTKVTTALADKKINYFRYQIVNKDETSEAFIAFEDLDAAGNFIITYTENTNVKTLYSSIETEQYTKGWQATCPDKLYFNAPLNIVPVDLLKAGGLTKEIIDLTYPIFKCPSKEVGLYNFTNGKPDRDRPVIIPTKDDIVHVDQNISYEALPNNIKDLNLTKIRAIHIDTTMPHDEMITLVDEVVGYSDTITIYKIVDNSYPNNWYDWTVPANYLELRIEHSVLYGNTIIAIDKLPASLPPRLNEKIPCIKTDDSKSYVLWAEKPIEDYYSSGLTIKAGWSEYVADGITLYAPYNTADIAHVNTNFINALSDVFKLKTITSSLYPIKKDAPDFRNKINLYQNTLGYSTTFHDRVPFSTKYGDNFGVKSFFIDTTQEIKIEDLEAEFAKHHRYVDDLQIGIFYPDYHKYMATNPSREDYYNVYGNARNELILKRKQNQETKEYVYQIIYAHGYSNGVGFLRYWCIWSSAIWEDPHNRYENATRVGWQHFKYTDIWDFPEYEQKLEPVFEEYGNSVFTLNVGISDEEFVTEDGLKKLPLYFKRSTVMLSDMDENGEAKENSPVKTYPVYVSNLKNDDDTPYSIDEKIKVAISRTDHGPDEFTLIKVIPTEEFHEYEIDCSYRYYDIKKDDYIDWGDGIVQPIVNRWTIKHVYDSKEYGKIKSIRIFGKFNGSNSSGDALWNTMVYASLGGIGGMSSFWRPKNIERIDNATFAPLENGDSFFMYCNKLTESPALSTSTCKSMNNMFYGCTALMSVAPMSTANVVSMNSMFNSCKNLKTVPLMDTSKVTDMKYMFKYCDSLTNIPNFKTNAVTSMRQMFYSCPSLIGAELQMDLAVNNYDLSAVPSYDIIFPKLDTTNVTDMSEMFCYCDSLITIPEFNTSKVTTMARMFNGCSALRVVPKLNLTNVTDLSSIFNNCKNVEEINMININANLDIRNCTKMTREALKVVLNNLVKQASGETKTLNLGSTLLNKLTDDDKLIATNKGWNLV